MYDIVTLGEGMLRLSPPPHERLRRARSLDLQVCGSQGNVACNLANLGLRAAFATKLPDHALGQLLREHYAGFGVDVSTIKMVPDARIGVNFIEFGATPRASMAIYDRRHSAASTIAPDDWDWDQLLKGTRIAYTDGIMPGLSDSCLAATGAFIDAARRQGCLVGFDTNYREHLWSPQQAASVISELMPKIDILLSSPGDIETLFDIGGSPESIVQAVQEQFGCRIVGLTLGEILSVSTGAIKGIVRHDGQTYRGRRYEVDAVDRFGAGDAWGAGLMYGYLSRNDFQYAVDFADALCAADFTIHGDVACMNVTEVEKIMNGKEYRVTR